MSDPAVHDHAFCESDRAAVYKVIAERRDMRHFIGGEVAPALLAKLLAAAHQAPSVGLMQPWRFLRISDRGLRSRIQALVEEERMHTAEALGERSDEFMKLKVEGINDCAEVLVVALTDDRERHIFGRRTLPEMDMASVSCAIQNLWLAARAEGIGVGWVSILDPARLRAALGIPGHMLPVAYLCLGYVDQFATSPELERAGWEKRIPLEEAICYDRYTEEKQS